MASDFTTWRSHAGLGAVYLHDMWGQVKAPAEGNVAEIVSLRALPREKRAGSSQSVSSTPRPEPRPEGIGIGAGSPLTPPARVEY